VRTAIDHREAILQTAAKLFARKPFHEVLMDDVAESVGIAKGTIYRYFPNKEELFVALAMHYLEVLGNEMGQVAALNDPPLARVKLMVARFAEIFEEHNDFFKVMQRHECELWARKYSDLLQRRTVFRDHFASVIKEAQVAKQIQLPFDAKAAADMLLGMVRNVLQFTTPRPSPDALAEMAMHIFVKGLGVARTGGAA
jgi:AcrR family transcriptional regulator